MVWYLDLGLVDCLLSSGVIGLFFVDKIDIHFRMVNRLSCKYYLSNMKPAPAWSYSPQVIQPGVALSS